MSDADILVGLNVIAWLVASIGLGLVSWRLRRLRWAVRGLTERINRLMDREVRK